LGLRRESDIVKVHGSVIKIDGENSTIGKFALKVYSASGVVGECSTGFGHSTLEMGGVFTRCKGSSGKSETSLKGL
jgi:hypothetical protein